MLNEDIVGKDLERYQKELKICPDCHQMSLEREYNVLGLLCCLSTWWICGLGCVFCKYEFLFFK
uniref:LITAF domain-containing protein n=1 Tax=Heterorhabditis bacteriophora TaxID=37862 RepID=A0A1I7X299_HETBA